MPIAQLIGRGTAVNVALEGTYGTSASQATASSRVESIEVTAGASRPQLRALGAGTMGFGGPSYKESVTATFTMSIRAHYTIDGLATLLRWMDWGSWSTSGAGPYTHTKTAGSSRLGATLRFNTGTAVGSATPEGVTLVGATVTRARVELSAPGVMTITVEGEALSVTLGSAHTLNAAPSTNTPIIHHQGSTLAWNSITTKLNSLTLEIDNGLTPVRQIGDLGPGDMVQTGTRVVTLAAELYDAGQGWAGVQIDGDVSDAVISFSASPHSFEITLPDAEISEPVRISITGPAARTVAVTFRGTGSTGAAFELVNGNSSAEGA